MQKGLQEEVESALVEARLQWKRRLDAIQADRRRKGSPLEADFAEQAVQRENDETLDALDAQGRRELQAIDAALERIAAGTYGDCVRCDEKIPDARLRTLPTAIDCVSCADPENSGTD